MPKLIFLGTSASISNRKRDTASLLIKEKPQSILIDCPGSIIQKLDKLKIKPPQIKSVIITHKHPDHLYGLPHLIHALLKTNITLSIFTNKNNIPVIKKLLQLFNLNNKGCLKLKYIDVFQSNFFLKTKALKIKALKNNHTKDSFAIKIISKNQKTIYSSDTAISKEIIKAAKDCSILIHDCTATSSYFEKNQRIAKLHTNSKMLSEKFKNSSIKKVIPIHFLLLDNQEEKKIKKELVPLKNKLFIPNDFDNILI